MHRPLRTFATPLIFLLGGMAVSVVVAEACALRSVLRDPVEAVLTREKPTEPWAPNTYGGWIAFGAPPHPDPGPVFARLDAIEAPAWAESYTEAVRTAPIRLIMVTRGPGLRDECLGYWIVTPENDGSTETMIHRRAGWPFPALCATGWSSGTLADPRGTERWIHSAPAPAWLAPRRFVPGDWRSNLPRRLLLEPLPLGLLADSVLYGGVLAAPVMIVRAFRRALRLRRNHCPACNYNRHGLPAGAPCPECGPASLSAP